MAIPGHGPAPTPGAPVAPGAILPAPGAPAAPGAVAPAATAAPTVAAPAEDHCQPPAWMVYALRFLFPVLITSGIIVGVFVLHRPGWRNAVVGGAVGFFIAGVVYFIYRERYPSRNCQPVVAPAAPGIPAAPGAAGPPPAVPGAPAPVVGTPAAAVPACPPNPAGLGGAGYDPTGYFYWDVTRWWWFNGVTWVSWNGTAWV